MYRYWECQSQEVCIHMVFLPFVQRALKRSDNLKEMVMFSLLLSGLSNASEINWHCRSVFQASSLVLIIMHHLYTVSASHVEKARVALTGQCLADWLNTMRPPCSKKSSWTGATPGKLPVLQKTAAITVLIKRYQQTLYSTYVLIFLFLWE